MDEKRFEEILVTKLEEVLVPRLENVLDKRFSESEERIKTEIYKKMDENDERLERKIDKKLEYLENKIDENREYLENKIDENREYLENKIDENHKYLEKKIVDNAFYFEHTYGEKISAIFDKLQLNDDLKKIENEENEKIQEQIEKNSAKLMSHELRISALEKKFNSKIN